MERMCLVLFNVNHVLLQKNRKRTNAVLEYEVRREKRENDRVIKKNKVIGKVLERSKINVARQGEKVISLSDTVREARKRTREAKKME